MEKKEAYSTKGVSKKEKASIMDIIRDKDEDEGTVQRVIVTDINITFFSMVHLMFKAFFAAIPAAVLIYITVYVVGGAILR